MTELSGLPAVHAIVEEPGLADAVRFFGRPAVVRAARLTLEEMRSERRVPERATILAAVRQQLEQRALPFQRVINATGILLHTNLGRAPLADAAWEAMAATRGFCNLELDLTTGKRASRLRDVDAPLQRLTGAAAGLAVNNNAAAVLLCAAALAGARPTAVSRGHLLEIGGGFRLPDIITASGSPLLEVGTTNRTHLEDYERAIDSGARLVLLVHRANFVMRGYVKEPSIADVVALAHARGVRVALDLGSGAIYDTTEVGLGSELRVQTALEAGVDVVCFSADKLLGGPQAGLVVGAHDVINAMRNHPIARAVRCDKLTLAALLATLDLHERAEARHGIPLLQLLDVSDSELAARVAAWVAAVGDGEIVEADGQVGGGCLPETRVAGYALALDVAHPERLVARLRAASPAVLAHISHDRVLLHARTVFRRDDGDLVAALRDALADQSALSTRRQAYIDSRP